MRVLMATSEAVPFCKTGGLGDVCGSLPRELARLGHEVALVLPAFREAMHAGLPLHELDLQLEVPIGRKTVRGTVLESCLPESDVPVYLIRQDAYYDRPALYGDQAGDYRDNCERFVFFARAVLQLIRQMDVSWNVLHAHDWTTGLIPAYLQTEYADLPEYENLASLFTIHNLAYQGNFWHWDMELTGIDWKHFNWREMEFFGHLSFMKTAIAFADRVNTVSPQYAIEIQTPPLSCGMEGILSHRRDDLSGVINGVDYRTWDPAGDVFLNSDGYAQYDSGSVEKGKAACKRALQRELGLSEDPRAPLLGVIGRLVEQKGIELIAQVAQQWASTSPVQWAFLGTGEKKYHTWLADLAARFPRKVAARLEFSNALAHRIEAGADIFVMPSRYEPCGLNQLYSLRYGTIPVVRATGGLVDTVTDTTDQSLASGKATGFCFQEYSQWALADALGRATDTYEDREVFQQLIQNGMQQDWSWARSAAQYVELYQATLAKKREATVLS